MERPIKLAILGATGMAGRDALLHQHYLDVIGRQYAKITCVTASQSSAGKKLGDVFTEKETALANAYSFWKPQSCPEGLYELIMDPTDADIIASKADYAISALGSDVANWLEPELARRGVHIFSNASSFRWKEDVPLLIPEVNYHDLSLVELQETPGKLVCNPNCTTAGFTSLIKALEDLQYKIKSISLATQQAISGKGDAIAEENYAKNITGNVLDDWTKAGQNSEEWKSAFEPMKILGRIRTKAGAYNAEEAIQKGKQTDVIPIYSQTTRVATQYGHLEYLMLEFYHDVNGKQMKDQLAAYELPDEVARLPTTQNPEFKVLDRMPDVKKDVFLGDGMAVVVGDIKQHTPNRVSLYTLTHNLRRGATWAGRQGMELFLEKYAGMKL